MTETTTIQVRKDQAEQLKQIARQNGNYKTVIDRLIEGYNDTTTEGNTSMNEAELAEYLADYLINGENLPDKIASELR